MAGRRRLLRSTRLAVLSLVEMPGWCVEGRRCYWSCYPDFSRNYHMSYSTSMFIEGPLLLTLAVIALVDVVSLGMLDQYYVLPGKGA